MSLNDKQIKLNKSMSKITTLAELKKKRDAIRSGLDISIKGTEPDNLVHVKVAPTVELVAV